jgi:hypothetical protein
MKFTYIDTSRADMSSSIKQEDIYLYENLDGSGKFRAQNYEQIQAGIPEILHTFPPGDVSVVVHSGAGGSGSVIGPLLAKKLKEKGHVVIVLMVGSKASRIDAMNTVKTIYSYENIARNCETPLTMYYRTNSKDTPQTKVDAAMSTTLVLLSALFSGSNRKLDSADLKNFIDYTKVTEFEASLVSLEVTFEKPYEVTKNTLIPATLALGAEGSDLINDSHVPYHTYGYLSPDQTKIMNVTLPVWFTQVVGLINTEVESLNKWVEEADELMKLNTTRVGKMNTGSTATSSGMVL